MTGFIPEKSALVWLGNDPWYPLVMNVVLIWDWLYYPVIFRDYDKPCNKDSVIDQSVEP